MKTKLAILAAAGLTLVSAAAYAQMGNHGSADVKGRGDMMGPGMMQQMHGNGMRHGGGAEHGAATQPKGDTGPSSLAFNGINAKMHESMNITFTGNADVDFVK